MIKVYNTQEAVAHAGDPANGMGRDHWVRLEDLPHGYFPRPDDLDYFSQSHPSDEDAAVMARITMERAVVRTLCDELIEQGFQIRLHDGEAWATGWTKERSHIMFEMMATDVELLHAKRGDVGADLIRGAVTFVYGNAGYEVISDNSTVLEPFMTKTTAFTDTLQEGKIT